MASDPRGSSGPELDRRAEALGVKAPAGQGYDGRQLAAAIVGGVDVVPVEDVIEDRTQSGVAGPGGNHDLLRLRRGNLAQIDPLPPQLVAIELFVAGKEEFLDRIPRPHLAVERQLAGRLQPAVEQPIVDQARTGHAAAIGDPLVDQHAKCREGKDFAHWMKLLLVFDRVVTDHRFRLGIVAGAEGEVFFRRLGQR